MSFDLSLGDCLDPLTGLASLADKSVDVVIMDPPYSAHVHASARRGSMATAARGMAMGGDGRAYKSSFSRSMDLGFDSLDDVTRIHAALEIARLARRWVLVFSDTESAHLWREDLTNHGLEYVRTVFWHKVGGAPQFTGDRPAVACEAITVCHQPGKKKWNGGGRQGLYQIPIVLERGDGETRVHTTQKPERLMDALVADFSAPGDTVLDPFAGSGTTGVAAIRLGRRFIGWERDEKYHALATKRLAGTREQLTIAAPRGPKAKQGVLL